MGASASAAARGRGRATQPHTPRHPTSRTLEQGPRPLRAGEAHHVVQQEVEARPQVIGPRGHPAQAVGRGVHGAHEVGLKAPAVQVGRDRAGGQGDKRAAQRGLDEARRRLAGRQRRRQHGGREIGPHLGQLGLHRGVRAPVGGREEGQERRARRRCVPPKQGPTPAERPGGRGQEVVRVPGDDGQVGDAQAGGRGGGGGRGAGVGHTARARLHLHLETRP